MRKSKQPKHGARNWRPVWRVLRVAVPVVALWTFNVVANMEGRADTNQCVTPATQEVRLQVNTTAPVSFSAQPCASQPSANAECEATGSSIEWPSGNSVTAGPYPTAGRKPPIRSPLAQQRFTYQPTTRNVTCDPKLVPLPTTQVAVYVEGAVINVTLSPWRIDAGDYSTATVSLTDGEAGVSYPITLSSEAPSPTTQPVATLEFTDGASFALTTANTPHEVAVKGKTVGYATLQATCTVPTVAPTTCPAQVEGPDLTITDMIWPGTGSSKSDTNDDPGDPTETLAAGPKTLGADADQKAALQLELGGRKVNGIYTWSLVNCTGGTTVSSGTFPPATEAKPNPTVVEKAASGNRYYVKIDRGGDAGYNRQLNVDVPNVDLVGYTATFQAIGEDKEEDPGLSLVLPSHSMVAKPTQLSEYTRELSWNNADKIIVEDVSGAQPTTRQSPVSLASDDNEREFRLRPTTRMSVNDTVLFTQKVSGSGRDFVDRVSVAMPYQVEILKVPEYLFATATYATPVKFKIVGKQPANYSIESITISLCDGAEELMTWTTTGSGRYGAGDASGGRLNGTSDTYTAFVPASKFQTISLDAGKTGNARFVARVDFRPAGENQPLFSASSLPDLAACKVKTFADKSYPALDLAPANAAATHTMPFSPLVSREAQTGPDPARQTFQYWQRGSNISTPLGEITHADAMWLGFDAATHTSSVTATSLTLSTSVYQECHLSGVFGSGDGLKSRLYGMRRGGLFFVSYPGRNDLPSGILAENERAMDLAKASGNFDLTMFPTGKVTIVNKCDNGQGISLAGALSGTFAIGSALALEVPPLSAFLAVVSGAFDIIDAVDLNTGITDSAEGAIYFVATRTRPGVAGVVDGSFFPPEGSTANGPTSPPSKSRPFTDFGKACNTGDQFLYYIDLESASSGVTRRAYPLSMHTLNVNNTTTYSSSAAGEFQSYVVTISE